MSLENEFYPDDGHLLTRFDNLMIKLVGKIGEAYQHVTGRSYKDLVLPMFLIVRLVVNCQLIRIY